MKKFVFPDSSVLLHYAPLDEIGLPKLLESMEVEVLLSLAVTEQLVYYQGDRSAPELGRRANETLKRLEKWLEGQHVISPGVTASFIGRQPGSETMERHGFNWQDLEDMLLGTLLEYEKERPDKAIILLTSDIDLAARARSLGIRVVAVPDEYLLTESIEALPVEKQRLNQGPIGSRYHMPHLSLSFAGGSDEKKVAIAPQLDSLTTSMRAQLVVVAGRMRREAAQLQADDEIEVTLDDLSTLAALVAQALPDGGTSLPGAIAEGESELYRQEVDAYPEKFERYLHRCLEMINAQRRTIRLDLGLENKGGASAERVLLKMTLPEQLEWHWNAGERDMPAPPAPPTPPKLVGQTEASSHNIGRVSSVSSSLLDRDHESGQESVGASPVISAEKTHLTWELGTYHQRQSRLLAPLYVRFRRADEISDFAIPWEILEKSRSDRARGQLIVSVDTTTPAREVNG